MIVYTLPQRYDCIHAWPELWLYTIMIVYNYYCMVYTLGQSYDCMVVYTPFVSMHANWAQLWLHGIGLHACSELWLYTHLVRVMVDTRLVRVMVVYKFGQSNGCIHALSELWLYTRLVRVWLYTRLVRVMVVYTLDQSYGCIHALSELWLYTRLVRVWLYTRLVRVMAVYTLGQSYDCIHALSGLWLYTRFWLYGVHAWSEVWDTILTLIPLMPPTVVCQCFHYHLDT